VATLTIDDSGYLHVFELLAILIVQNFKIIACRFLCVFVSVISDDQISAHCRACCRVRRQEFVVQRMLRKVRAVPHERDSIRVGVFEGFVEMMVSIQSPLQLRKVTVMDYQFKVGC
jgi:hypothetical protein